MTKRELIEANEELCNTLLALRAMIDEALAASGIAFDQDEDDHEDDESDEDEEEDEDEVEA
jgi:hypothetical protein